MVNFSRGTLKYRKGDATQPQSGGFNYIIHICNNLPGWGKGFVLALSKRWKKPEEQYRLWARSRVLDNIPFKLGEIQIVPVQSDCSVINMIAQEGIETKIVDGVEVPPIRYEALRSCLNKVAKEVKDNAGMVCGPRFGAGLSGGDWNVIEQMIDEILIEKGINVTIYDLE